MEKKSNSLKLSVTIGNKEISIIGINELLSFEPEMFLGDEKVAPEELKNFFERQKD